MHDDHGTPLIYVASRVRHAAMWRRHRDAGTNIISSWIDQAGPGETPDIGALWQQIVAEVTLARWLVLYIEPDDFPLKGALVEAGIALGHGREVIVVAPRVELEPVSYRPIGGWCRHPSVRFAGSIGDALNGFALPRGVYK
jgi:hypothetical protein